MDTRASGMLISCLTSSGNCFAGAESRGEGQVRGGADEERGR